MELGGGRVRMTQVSGLPTERLFHFKPAAEPNSAFIASTGMYPTSGFQRMVGIACPPNRVVSRIFKDLLAKRGWRGSVLGRAALQIGQCRGAPVGPCGGSLHWGACSLSPACLCVAVCRCPWPPVCRQTVSDPRGEVSVSRAVELENIDQVPRLVFLGKHFPEPTTMLHLI